MKKFVVTCLLLLGWVCLASAAEIPESFVKVQELDGIEEYRLSENGLTVLLMEDHSAPVLTYMVTYRVGSRNEVTGTTGATHILEHLMFKGTDMHNKKDGTGYSQNVDRIGAGSNATTWVDRTNYFAVVPSNYLELMVKMEADRMRNLWLRDEDRQAEMTVVRNEFERGENSPFSVLDREIWATAYQAHPYHHSTIGWRSDIENVPIEKLREFYDTFYWPNNATVTIIGDFDRGEALSLVEKYYGPIPASPKPIPEVYTTEPEQLGPRRLIVKKAGQLGVVGIGHKVPEGLHPDTYPLIVLDNILTNGKTSRFYRNLVDAGLTTSTFVFYVPFKDPGLFTTYAFLAPDATHETVEQTILAEYEQIKTVGVTEAEVQRAISQIRARTAFDRDGSYSIASDINEAIAMGDWTYYVTFLENIEKVTPERVQEVAQKYLVEDQSTTGYFVPVDKAASASEGSYTPGPSGWTEPDKRLYFRDPEQTPGMSAGGGDTSLDFADDIKRRTVGGVDLVTLKTNVTDVVTIQGSLAAGTVFSPMENERIAYLTGRMLEQGTRTHDKFQIAEKLADMGATINFDVETYPLEFYIRCLTDDVPAVIAILAEQLREPAFDETELEKLKKQQIGNLTRGMENTNAMAYQAMAELLYPPEHPNYIPTFEARITATEKVTVDDIKAFHEKYYGPEAMTIVAVGDLDEAVLETAIVEAFGDWQGGVSYPTREAIVTAPTQPKKIVTMEDKTSVSVRIAQRTGLKASDADYLPLMMGADILGGEFSARLMSIVRDEEGLTYGIYSSMQDDDFVDGNWFVSATFGPDLLQTGLASTWREIRRWYDEGVTAQELADKKTNLVGSYKVRLETTRGMAGRILDFLQKGYDVDYLRQYPRDIEAVTLEQVNNAIRTYLNPETMATAMAGSIDENEKPLTAN